MSFDRIDRLVTEEGFFFRRGMTATAKVYGLRSDYGRARSTSFAICQVPEIWI